MNFYENITRLLKHSQKYRTKIKEEKVEETQQCKRGILPDTTIVMK